MKNILHFFSVFAVFFGLVACSKRETSHPSTYVACPKPFILRQLSRHVNRSERQIASILTIERVAHSSCQVKKNNSWLETTVRLSATQGSAFPEDQETVTAPYFLAAVDPSGRVVAKTNHEVTIRFDNNYGSTLDRIRLDGLEPGTDVDFDALQFIVGLQVTPEE